MIVDLYHNFTFAPIEILLCFVYFDRQFDSFDRRYDPEGYKKTNIALFYAIGLTLFDFIRFLIDFKIDYKLFTENCDLRFNESTDNTQTQFPESSIKFGSQNIGETTLEKKIQLQSRTMTRPRQQFLRRQSSYSRERSEHQLQYLIVTILSILPLFVLEISRLLFFMRNVYSYERENCFEPCVKDTKSEMITNPKYNFTFSQVEEFCTTQCGDSCDYTDGFNLNIFYDLKNAYRVLHADGKEKDILDIIALAIDDDPTLAESIQQFVDNFNRPKVHQTNATHAAPGDPTVAFQAISTITSMTTIVASTLLILFWAIIQQLMSVETHDQTEQASEETPPAETSNPSTIKLLHKYLSDIPKSLKFSYTCLITSGFLFSVASLQVGHYMVIKENVENLDNNVGFRFDKNISCRAEFGEEVDWEYPLEWSACHFIDLSWTLTL